jgi:hypothetical protein
MGFPVRVIATSDSDLVCTALRAILGVDRTAADRETILGNLGITRRLSMWSNWSRNGVAKRAKLVLPFNL